VAAPSVFRVIGSGPAPPPLCFSAFLAAALAANIFAGQILVVILVEPLARYGGGFRGWAVAKIFHGRVL